MKIRDCEGGGGGEGGGGEEVAGRAPADPSPAGVSKPSQD